MKNIFITIFLFLFAINNIYANDTTYSLDKTNLELTSIVDKSNNSVLKHIQSGGTCDSEGIKNDILNKMVISTNQLQQKIDDKYNKYNEQLKFNEEKLKTLYVEYDKLKIAYEKADNLHEDYYHNTGDYNYDLLKDSNYAYELKERKEKEIADFIKSSNKYIEDFDKSDIDFFINSNIESTYINLITDYCLNLKNISNIKVSTKNKNLDENNTKTKLQVKQDALKAKLSIIYKKSPKSIEKLLPQITKLKNKVQSGTDTYFLLETMETEITNLINTDNQ